MIYNRVALIGLGLIASSMFWAIRRRGLAGEVTGYARSQETRDTARRIGLCDHVCDSAAEAVQGADLVVLLSRGKSLGEGDANSTEDVNLKRAATGLKRRYSSQKQVGDKRPERIPKAYLLSYSLY